MRARGRELLTAAVVLAIAVVTAFGPALSGAVLSWDDRRFVDDDPAVRRPGLQSIALAFGTIHAEAYHPLHRLANAADRALFGRSPRAMHATSLALWTVALVAVVAFLRELGASRWAALAGALVVGVHPLQGEVVAWISGKKDILAMLFFASAGALAVGAEPMRSRRMAGALALHALGLLSKTSVVVLPVVLLMADVLVKGRPLRTALHRAAPFALLSLAAGIPVLAIWTDAQMIRPAPETGLAGRVAWVGHAFFHYAQTIAWPARLSILYPIDPGPEVDARALLGLALGALCLAAPFVPRLGPARFGLAFLGVALLPVANVVPLAFFVADRYASLALLAVGALVAVAIDAAHARRAPWSGSAVTLVVVAALVVMSRARAEQFTTDERLLRAAVAAQPRSYFAHMKLGEVLRDLGDLRGSVRSYRRAIELDPERPLAHGGLFLAVARLEVSRRDLDARIADRALSRYMRSLDDPQALWSLSRALQAEGLTDAALLPLERSLTLERPPDAQLREEAARALQRRDRKAAILLLRNVRHPDAAVRDALESLENGAR